MVSDSVRFDKLASRELTAGGTRYSDMFSRETIEQEEESLSPKKGDYYPARNVYKVYHTKNMRKIRNEHTGRAVGNPQRSSM